MNTFAKFVDTSDHHTLLQDDLISRTAHPPMYLKVDLETYDLKQLNCKFDTIIIGKTEQKTQFS